MDQWINSIMGAMGYWGVALLMLLENVFPPIPSELIMPMAGFSAASGKYSLWGVWLAGVIGSVAGQFPLYYLGKAIGQERLHRVADRYGKWVTVSGKDIDKASDWLRRRGPMALFLCRLVPGVRSLISIPAGASNVNLFIFTAYSTAGIAIWSGLLAGLGYLLGDNYKKVEEYIGPIGKWIWIGLGVLLVGWILWRVRGCISHSGAPCPFRDDDAKRASPTSRAGEEFPV